MMKAKKKMDTLAIYGGENPEQDKKDAERKFIADIKEMGLEYREVCLICNEYN